MFLQHFIHRAIVYIIRKTTALPLHNHIQNKLLQICTMGPSRFNMKLSNDEDLIMDSVYQRSEFFNSHWSTFTTKINLQYLK